MEKKRSKKYELRFEVASERNKIPGYTLIPKHDRSAEAQHMTEHEAGNSALCTERWYRSSQKTVIRIYRI